jgi:Peptidase C13 family
MSEADVQPASPLPAPPTQPASRTAWWREGARSAFFMRPRFAGDSPSPPWVLGVVLLSVLLSVLAQRLYIEGPAQFYWPALMAGWLGTALSAWVCWCLLHGAPQPPDGRAPSASALFAAACTQGLVWLVLVQALGICLFRLGFLQSASASQLAWWLPMAWWVAAQSLLFWRSGRGSAGLRGACVLALAVVGVVSAWSEPLRPWYPQEREENSAAVDKPFELTPELIEAQTQTLPQALARLAPQRPGLIDVYALTYAPYAEEDVFMRESRMVAGVMQQRFDAQGRSIELLNHKSTATSQPWATPGNLKRSLQHIAQLMDLEQDVLFIHLTSHGAQNGRLQARLWPLRLEPLTAGELKAALDEAGIRHRVISVSACYSGTWLEPLAGEHTLVMTAADTEHTSYGCGRGSELTYFGRAVFDEALRTTRDFEAAHASARKVIEQREKDAGKTDGYSNPQIRVGAAMQNRLRALQQQLAAR